MVGPVGLADGMPPYDRIVAVPAQKIKRVDLVARLTESDPYAPFRLHLGDEVAVLREDGTPDGEMSGVIVGGTCEYQMGRGSYRDSYEVKRADGTTFHARSAELVRREPPFANLREATRIVRDWLRPAHPKDGS